MAKKIKSPEELALLKDWVRGEVELRTAQKEMRIIVHMGTCGIAAGARDVLEQLATELTQNSIDNVSLRQAGCFGMCSHEPMITLVDKSGKEYRYGKLDKARIRRIVREHVMNGTPVVDYLVTA